MKTTGLKRAAALLLAALFALFCTGCGESGGKEPPETPSQNQGQQQGQSGQTQNNVPTETFDFSSEVQGLTMNVNRDTGRLSVKRVPLPSWINKGDSGKWTIFVYLCGTDLETSYGSATDDLIEIVDGAVGNGVRFVVETGGAEEWWNDTVGANKLQRFLVEDENIELVDEQRRTGMGRQETFADFLQWGVDNYASEHMGVILWNHGGGSITGICFDETDDYDSLSLRELDGAFLSVCGNLGRKFDFVGFDACLMGSLEAANILASYADYMYASQETEPGTGWDYVAMGKYLGANPDTDAKQLGIVTCDSFYESCAAVEEEDLCTLSVIDLSKLDALLVSFNDFAHGMYDSAADTANCVDMIRGISQVDNFGGNNRSEGYTNMVDMGGIISACESYSDGARDTLNALENAVVYSVSGNMHETASGLSMYYPLSVQGSEELAIFGDICPSPYYLSCVDRQNQGSVDVDSVDDYDDDFWFDDDGNWFWGLFFQNYQDEDYENENDWFDGYWDYLDDYEPTGESPLITFAVEPHLDEDGDFWFELDDSGWEYAADVYGLVYELSEDGEDLIELGQTYDLRGGWDTGIFMDDFDGYWLSLPDGQNLVTYIVEDTGDYVIYTSPIRLNGEETNLRLRQDYEDGTVTVEGAWDGLNEYGAASREIVKLKAGDVIVPLYNAYSLETDDEFYYHGVEFTVTGDFEIYYDIMEDGDYVFAFCIDDLYGDYYISDFAMFTVEDGEVWYDLP